MLCGLLRRLFIVAPSLVLASTTTTAHPPTASLTSLPSSLATSIPECASSCVVDSLNAGFPSSCTIAGDLACLCSRFSSTGFTLPEVALGCVFAACPQAVSSSSQAGNAFQICAGQQNVAIGTHSILTVTQQPPTSTKSNLPSPTSSRTTTTQTSLTTSVITSASGRSSSLPSATGVSSQIPSPAPSTSASSSTGPTASAAEATSGAATANSGIGPLSTGQIVGITVAGAATMIVVIGGIVAITCIQRRRERLTRREQSMEGKLESGDAPPFIPQPWTPTRQVIMQQPPGGLKDPRGGVGGVGVARTQTSPRSSPSPRRQSPVSLPKIKTSSPPPPSRHRHQLSDERANSAWVNPDVAPEAIGLAISPESDHSPDSFQSSRTVSRLLPERPRSFLRPSDIPKAATRFPVRPQGPRPDSTVSQMTVFEEDSKTVPDSPVGLPLPLRIGIRPPVDAMPAARLSPSNVRTRAPPPAQVRPQPQPQPQTPPRPRPAPSLSDDRSSMESNMQVPPLALRIPERGSKGPVAPAPSTPPRQITSPVRVYAPPTYTSPREEASPLFSRIGADNSTPPPPPPKNDQLSPPRVPQKVQGYLPRYYTRNTAADGSKISPRLINIPGPNHKSTASNSSQSNTHSRVSTARSGRDSIASCTTFESVDLEEITPPEEEEDKQLSPVAESPISGLRYPKVPRPSNQAVPRSPPAEQRDLLTSEPASAQSLLAKRRGGEAASDFERRLWLGGSTVSNSIYSRASNLSGHSGASRAYNHNRTGSDGTIKEFQQRPHKLDLAVPKGPLSAEMAQGLKSPLWAPRITPTRRGDDLFLSVSKIYSD